MFTNYLKMALRNLKRNKLYSFLNIFGLSIGIISAVLILLYVQHELSYDKYNSKYERIFRLSSDFAFSGKEDQAALTQLPLGFTMKDEYPEIENVCRFFQIGKQFYKYKDREFYEENIFLADSTIFDIFDYKFVMGTKKGVLNAPYQIVITESFAKKYFGNNDPIGKVIRTGTGNNVTVTAVIEDVPENSHMKFQALISMATLAELYGGANFDSRDPSSFWRVSCYTYLLLKKGGNIDELLAKYPAFYDKYMGAVGDQINGSFNITAFNIADIHLYSDLGWDLPTGNLDYVIIFSIIGICILLIACINYMNMATARSAKRAREVGIRKVLGANRSLILRQFLSESVIFAFFAMLIAIITVALLLPLFNNITGKHFTLSVFANPLLIIEIIILTILVGLISGSYPAFYLSSLLPVKVLKGNDIKTGKGGLLRKILVVVQFAISIAMIIGTLLVNSQLNYLQDKDIGLNKENVLVTQIRDTSFQRSYPAFKDAILQNPNIKSVCTTTSAPGTAFGKLVFRVQNGDKMDELVQSFIFVDYDFLNMFGIKLLQGRFYKKDMGTDIQNAVVINETAAKKLGWGKDALGKKVHFGVNLNGPPIRDCRVVGVVKDFNFASLHEPIEPLMIMLSENPNRLVNIRISGNNTQQTIDFIKKNYSEFNKTYPLDYEFLDDMIKTFYEDDEKMSEIIGIFAVICILISCLGLLGLSSYITEQRTKEIGIRKVLGATVSNIVVLLSKDFMKLVLISNVISWPIAYYALSKWLEDFAYKTNINLWAFILSTIAAILIAIITISFQAVKAALTDPSDTLKYE